ncbi:hypothetical protein [Chloroflexus sp.]|nr:hypothetical protein [Chloroflexus sp.]
MKDFGYTLLLIFGLFLLFVGLKGAMMILAPHLRSVSRSLADYLETV